MKKVILVLITLLFSMGLVTSTGKLAIANPFINPPEINAPDWQTVFPYQRNIYWDFQVNPEGGPPGPLPGAHYEGWLDQHLWSSDYVDLSGDVVWDGYNAIGIGGAGGGSGEAIFHLDNLINTNPVKHVYLEATVINSDPDYPESFWGPPYLRLPEGYTQHPDYWGYFWTEQENDTWLLDMWFEITPNPSWEDVVLPFDVPNGKYVWIDDLHIATECVPEPFTMLLLGSGLIGLIGIERKRIRKDM